MAILPWIRSTCCTKRGALHAQGAGAFAGVQNYLLHDGNTFREMLDSARQHGQRTLVLNDNMGVVLAVMRRRYSSYGLLRLLRMPWAHSLACNIRLCRRWVVSEHNVAHHDSRTWEAKGGDWKSGAGAQSRDLHESGGRGSEQEMPKPLGARRGGEDFAEMQQVQEAEPERKRRRACERERQYGKKLRATQGCRTIPEMGSVKDPTQKDYEKKLSLFYDFIAFHGLGGHKGGTRRGALGLRRLPVCEWRGVQLWPKSLRQRSSFGGRRPQGRDPGAPPVQASSEG